MRIEYGIDDGYAGGSRPHSVEVDDESLEECETDAEREEVIEAAIRDDMANTLYPYWDRKQLADCPRPKEQTE